MIYSYDQLVQYAQQAGFSSSSSLIIAAIALAESGGDPLKQHTNVDGSIDRGILQINNVYHSEVSDSCAYNVACAFQAAYAISNGGTNFQPWVTYQTGAYQKYVSNAAAVSPLQTAFPSLTTIALSGWLDPIRIAKLISGTALVIGVLYMTLESKVLL